MERLNTGLSYHDVLVCLSNHKISNLVSTVI